jgi:UDP-N-acetylglucosamine 2-epimerase (non-hydrolysing)
VLKEVKPNVVFVHGDTSTTFVIALACFYMQIPVGHVEAELRTFNIYSPYLEDFNRQAVASSRNITSRRRKYPGTFTARRQKA